MNYPFQKKSFWIIFLSFSLLLLIISYAELRTLYLSPVDKIFSFLFFMIAIIFVADYLGHLIFLKPDKK